MELEIGPTQILPPNSFCFRPRIPQYSRGCTYLGSPARFKSIARFVDKKSLVFFGRGSGAPQLHPRSSYGNFPMHPSRLLSASMMSSNFARHVADDRRPQRVLISRNDIALGRGSRPL